MNIKSVFKGISDQIYCSEHKRIAPICITGCIFSIFALGSLFVMTRIFPSLKNRIFPLDRSEKNLLCRFKNGINHETFKSEAIQLLNQIKDKKDFEQFYASLMSFQYDLNIQKNIIFHDGSEGSIHNVFHQTYVSLYTRTTRKILDNLEMATWKFCQKYFIVKPLRVVCPSFNKSG